MENKGIRLDSIYNIEEITLSESKDIDRYIIFALKYSYNNNSKKYLTLDELYKFLFGLYIFILIINLFIIGWKIVIISCVLFHQELGTILILKI